MGEYNLIEGQCGTCRWAKGFSFSPDGPSGPEDGVLCSSQAQAEMVDEQEQAEEPRWLPELKEYGHMVIWRLEAMAEESYRCPQWERQVKHGDLIAVERHDNGGVHSWWKVCVYRTPADLEDALKVVVIHPAATMAYIVNSAGSAFWRQVAQCFPAAKTGDFPPDASILWDLAVEESIVAWLQWNYPLPPR